jgi:signal transduction histidine kinase
MESNRIKILYVDDEKANLTNFKFLFQDDYNIFTTVSAKEGLEILKTTEIQIVISDQRMPDMTGIDFLSRISKLYPEIIRILLTAYTETKDILDAINIGQVYQYITKPFQEQVISNILKNASEIWLLKEANNNLIVELRAKNEEYEQINEELRQSNEELQIAKDKTEESDRLKTAFLQNMSHEIRTPMNAIMGFSSLLAENFNNKDNLEKFSEIIKQRCSDLLEIINDILDISKIESGQLFVHLAECNIHELFEELTDFFAEYKKRIGKEHITLSMEAGCIHPENVVLTDKVKLKQIFINLLNNAFKFTDVGKIEGGCQVDADNNLLFYVSDTGIGIPLDQQQIIFERFSQLNPGSNKLVSGTGLGLPIVKGLVNLLGGEIHLRSEPKKGSTFSFSISKKPYLANQYSPDIENTSDQSMLNKTILIVEDDVYNIRYLKELLSGKGLNLLLAECGSDAIEMALNNPIDIVLMDIRLPDINGYEATRQIRKHKPDLKIIAQTAYAAQDEKQKAYDAGCDDYISKPTQKDSLLSILHKHLFTF